MQMEFPKDFLWGSATSAHQVEGGNRNDWSEWETEKSLEQSGRACDHYNRFPQDFDIAKSLNQNAHRFSIEWSRIEPEEGKWNEKEIAHYQEVINALRERGMEPFVTLWHWTLPVWVARQGGWENKKTIDDFARYVDKITRSLKNVAYWITLNEPEIYTMNSYLRGKWPPQKMSLLRYIVVMQNLVRAHKKAYLVIHQAGAKAGIAQNNLYFNWFLNKISTHQDFIGVNYYTYYKYGKNWKSDMNWPIYPEGIYHILKDLKKYNKPVYITENGVADAKDVYREKFIKEHLRWVHKAISEGVDVRGYFYWSLLDNFEWDKGFWPRFGLVEIDYKTMARRIRQSAYEYAKIAKENALVL